MNVQGFLEIESGAFENGDLERRKMYVDKLLEAE